jgi:hypothetical protein
MSNKPTTKSRRLIRSPHRQRRGEGATTDILHLSLDNTLFDSVHSKADKVAISKAYFEVLATSGSGILCSCNLVAGERPKAGCDALKVDIGFKT